MASRVTLHATAEPPPVPSAFDFEDLCTRTRTGTGSLTPCETEAGALLIVYHNTLILVRPKRACRLSGVTQWPGLSGGPSQPS